MGVRDRLVRVVDFESLALHRCGFESRQGLEFFHVRKLSSQPTERITSRMALQVRFSQEPLLEAFLLRNVHNYSYNIVAQNKQSMFLYGM